MDTSERAFSRTDWRIAGALAIGLAILYLATRVGVHNQCVDCLHYAFRIRSAPPADLFQGAHLIYLWLLRGLYLGARSFIPSADAMATSQTFNSITAAVAVGVFYLLVRGLVGSRWLSVSLALILAASYNYWLYATDAEVHAPAVVCCLLTLLIAFRLPVRPARRRLVGLGLLTAAAILFHVFSSLVGIVVVALIVLRWKDQGRGGRRSPLELAERLTIYGSTALVGVVVPYVVVGALALHFRTARQLVAWIFNFVDASYWTRAALPLGTTLALTVTGTIRAFLGLIPWVAVPGIGARLLHVFSDRCPAEELYLVRNLGAGTAAGLALSGAAAGFLLLVEGGASARGLIGGLRRLSRTVVAAVLWLLLYTAFIMVAAPGSSEHIAMYWIPTFLLCLGLGISGGGPATDRRRRLIQGASLLLAVSLFVTNLGSIGMLKESDSDIYIQRLSWFRRNAKPDDLLLSVGGYDWEGYLDYYVKAQSLDVAGLLGEMDYDQALRAVDGKIREAQAQGGRVFVLIDPVAPEYCQARFEEAQRQLLADFTADLAPRLSCSPHQGVSVCEVVG
jgi:hypothetical protein